MNRCSSLAHPALGPGRALSQINLEQDLPKEEALKSIKIVADALQKAKESAPSNAGFSIGLQSRHGGPEVLLGLPLHDRDETLRPLVPHSQGEDLHLLKPGDEHSTPIVGPHHTSYNLYGPRKPKAPTAKRWAL